MKTAINLLPAAYQRQLVVRRRALQWSVVLGIGLVVGGVVRWIDVRESRDVAQRLELLSQEHAPTQTMLKQLVDMRRELDESQQLAVVAAELEYQRPVLSLLGILSEIGERTGGKLRVTKLDLTGLQQAPSSKTDQRGATSAGILVSGVSLDNPSVAKLVTGLNDSGFFAHTYLVKSRELGEDTSALREYEVKCEF
jgi:hypothetical protein